MHSPPPLRRASLPLFTTTYNTANPTPPLLNTPAHTPPLFLDALESGSSLAHRDTQSVQTDTSSLFDFGEKLDYLTSSQQNNTLSYQLQTSYPTSQPQHQPQASLPCMSYLTPSPYLTPNPPDSNPTSYLTFGPGGNSTGVVTYSTGGHAYFQSQSTGQILLQSAGHHGGITAYQSYPWGNMYSQPTMHQRTQCPPNYPPNMGATRDHQPPSSTTLPPPPAFFPRGDHGLSHANPQRSSHTLTHTTSSTTTVLPPVSTLRPSRLRAESAPTKVALLPPSQLRVTQSHFAAVPLAWKSLRPAPSPLWLLTLRTICGRARTPAFSCRPSVSVTMTPTLPLFLLLLGLIGAQATVDLRMAAAMAAGLCKTRPTDIVFIIDSSRSVRPSEFEQVKVFLAKVIEGLDVGPNATRVGVVNYASRVSLKTHRSKAGLIKAVNKIEPLSTGTMTGLSIQFALNVAFSESEGARVKSPDISKVAIIVTDGRPQDNVKDVAQRARDAGIEIFAIGVGRVDMSTLRQMASDPLDDHVDYVESYSVIEKLTKKFQEAFCVSDLCATGDHDCEQVCISSPGSYKCACKDGFTLMDDGRSCSACSNSATDVVFLIDGSKSVRPENFELVKKWINQIIDKLDVSESKAHVGLVQYSSSVRQEFPLGRHNNKKDLKDAVKKIAYMERGTMTGQALRYLSDSSFSPSQGARPGVTKVGIVFTDGRSQDYIGDAAKKAKELGFKMYAVGVGNAVEDELKEIASEPTGEHYFYTADFKSMTQIAKKLQINICQEEDPCECDSLVKFQKKVEDALQALTKKYILYER
ncbi:hypothetical protein PAMP_008000 [Pampus punctatissimus]